MRLVGEERIHVTGRKCRYDLAVGDVLHPDLAGVQSEPLKVTVGMILTHGAELGRDGST
jgi:hypothetical protein